jgi:hypothetical protein
LPSLPGVLAAAAVREWKANTLKLQLDRYDRRLRIYEEVVAFIVLACRDFKPEIVDVIKFARATAEADFLFPADILAYIDELRKRALESRVAHLEYRDMTQRIPEGYDHRKVTDAMHEHSTWLAHQHDIALEKFRPYLDLSAAP